MKRDTPLYVGTNSPRTIGSEDFYNARQHKLRTQERSDRYSAAWNKVKRPLGIAGLALLVSVSVPQIGNVVNHMERSRIESVMNQDYSTKSYDDIQSTVFNLGIEKNFYLSMSEAENQMPEAVFRQNFEKIAQTNLKYALDVRYGELSLDKK